MFHKRALTLLFASIAASSAHAGTILFDSFDDETSITITEDAFRIMGPGPSVVFGAGQRFIRYDIFNFGSARFGEGTLAYFSDGASNLTVQYAGTSGAVDVSNWTHFNTRVDTVGGFFSVLVKFENGFGTEFSSHVLELSPGEASFALDGSNPFFVQTSGYDPTQISRITLNFVGGGLNILDHLSVTTSDTTRVPAVPEPFTMGLVALGLGVALKRRRK